MFTNKDFQFQGYNLPKDKKPYTLWQLRKWEREAEEQSWIEHITLEGDNNDFLEIYPQNVVIYHKVNV